MKLTDQEIEIIKKAYNCEYVLIYSTFMLFYNQNYLHITYFNNSEYFQVKGTSYLKREFFKRVKLLAFE